MGDWVLPVHVAFGNDLQTSVDSTCVGPHTDTKAFLMSCVSLVALIEAEGSTHTVELQARSNAPSQRRDRRLAQQLTIGS